MLTLSSVFGHSQANVLDEVLPVQSATGIHSEISNQALINAARQYLNTMPVIRVGIPLGPGMGHQSASASVVTRLRQLDYKGTIEIVYEPSQKSKLTYLFPPFTHLGPDTQEFPNLKLKFIPFQRYLNLPQVPFGILGAADHNYGAADFRVNVLLTLQPLLWDSKPNRIAIRHKKPHRSTHRNVKQHLKRLKSLGYLFEFELVKDVPSFVRFELGHDPDLRKKIAGLIQIFNMRGQLNFAPVYGHAISSGFQLLTYLDAITTALRIDPSKFEEKGIVIPVFSEVSDLTRELIPSYISPSAKIAFSDIRDPSLPTRLKGLRSGEVLVVFTGKVTKRVFEQMYLSSTLPPIVEGRNSINFMQMIGRPYFPSDDLTDGFHFETNFQTTNQEERAAFRLAMEAKKEIISNDRQTRRRHDDLDFGLPWGARFILQSMNTNSATSKLFKKYQVSPKTHLFQDKLIRGLLLTQKFANQVIRSGGHIPGWPVGACVSLISESAAIETSP